MALEPEAVAPVAALLGEAYIYIYIYFFFSYHTPILVSRLCLHIYMYRYVCSRTYNLNTLAEGMALEPEAVAPVAALLGEDF